MAMGNSQKAMGNRQWAKGKGIANSQQLLAISLDPHIKDHSDMIGVW
jgi:hypothetical protein